MRNTVKNPVKGLKMTLFPVYGPGGKPKMNDKELIARLHIGPQDYKDTGELLVAWRKLAREAADRLKELKADRTYGWCECGALVVESRRCHKCDSTILKPFDPVETLVAHQHAFGACGDKISRQAIKIAELKDCIEQLKAENKRLKGHRQEIGPDGKVISIPPYKNSIYCRPDFERQVKELKENLNAPAPVKENGQ